MVLFIHSHLASSFFLLKTGFLWTSWHIISVACIILWSLSPDLLPCSLWHPHLNNFSVPPSLQSIDPAVSGKNGFASWCMLNQKIQPSQRAEKEGLTFCCSQGLKSLSSLGCPHHPQALDQLVQVCACACSMCLFKTLSAYTTTFHCLSTCWYFPSFQSLSSIVNH